MPKFGEFTTAFLIVAIFSGFVVNYQYELTDPFVSAVAMETVLPFGAFWRALHFWSGQFFFLALLYHAVDHIWDHQAFSRRLSPKGHWTIMVFTLPGAILILFTGYVLRLDATGRAAASIYEHLLTAIPLVGTGLNRLMASLDQEGLNRIYIVHLLLTCLIWGIGTWYHTKKVLLGPGTLLVAAFAAIFVSAFVHAPIDLPGAKVHLIKGPWFFLGIQELLRHVHPLVAGILFPAIPVVLFGALSWTKRRDYLLVTLGLWLLGYLLLTVLALMR